MKYDQKKYDMTYRLKKYGITEDQYKAQWRKQKGCCAICGERLHRPHLDHDHVNGEFRAILCGLCNAGLGMFHDSPRLLARAIVYLEEHGIEY